MRGLLERFHARRAAEDGDPAWIGWLEAVTLLGLRDLAPLVHAAWDDGRIPDNVLHCADFDADLSATEHAPGDIARFDRAHLGYVEDVIEALEWTRGAEDLEDLVPDLFDPPAASGPPAPIINPWHRVGRYDPCPCGSGRKAKTCCLAK